MREAGPAEAPKRRLLDRRPPRHVREGLPSGRRRGHGRDVPPDEGVEASVPSTGKEGKHADTSGRHSPLAARWHRRCHLLLRQLEVVRPVVIASSARHHLLPVFCGES